MAAVTLPSEVECQPFTDEQIASFATAADCAYANPDQLWRTDLDDAVKELLIEYGGKGWPTPSSLRTQLVAVMKNPDAFIHRLADEAELRDSPIATAILHGTRWRPEQLEKAGECREQFIAGVTNEIKWLDTIIERRKESGLTRNVRNVAMDGFIDRLAWIYQDAFLQAVNVKLSVPTSSRKRSHTDGPTGPFIRFAQAVLNAIASHLPQGDSTGKALRRTAISGSAVLKRLKKTDAYQLAKQDRKSNSDMRNLEP